MRRRPGSDRARATRHVVVWGVLVAALFVFVATAPLLAPHDPLSADLSAVNQPPSAEYPLGTDAIGRCIYSRILDGMQASLFAALAVVALCFVIGSIVGVVSGYVGGALDAVLSRVTDAFMAFPQLVLSIAVAGLLGGGLMNAIIALTVPGWTRFARLARGQTLAVKGRTFVLAERAAGASSLFIAVRHVLPNILPTLIVTAVLDVGATVLNLAGLSFLGLGAMPPAPELGSMINQASSTFSQAPWGVFAPGAALFVIVVVLNMFGDAVNDALVAEGTAQTAPRSGGIARRLASLRRTAGAQRPPGVAK